MKLTKLNEVYEDWLTGDGVFTDLNNFDVPWKNENNVNALNMAYHGSHSGDKNISPIVFKFLESEDEHTRTKLAGVIFTMFADKWSKLWTALNVQYNPLSNYDLVESESIRESVDNTETHTGTETTTMTGTDTVANSGKDTTKMTGTDTVANSGSDVLTMTGTDTHAKTGTETETHTGTNTVEHDGTNENEVSAFNSSTYQDNEKNTIDTTDEETRNTTDTTTYNTSDVETRNMTDTTQHGKTETETRNMTDEVTHGKTETETRNMTDTLTHNTTNVLDGDKESLRTLARSGNIGVTTSQQMLQSEIDLRKWLYYQSVFNDIDSILTLSIY